MTHGSALLMTMSDVAALARVKRPVVSVWRSRAAHTDRPFPAPVSQRGNQALFDAYQIGEWLADTHRGNNPEALADVAAHATLGLQAAVGGPATLAGQATPTGSTPEGAGLADSTSFPALTGLLALRHSLGHPLSALSNDELLDAADEYDPDDEVFFREVDGAGADRHTLAAYVDALVEAAYNDVDAFERLISDRGRIAGRSQGDSLSQVAVDLMAEVALTLAATQYGDATFVDSTGSAGEVIVGISNHSSALNDLTVLSPDDERAAARLVRRRLLVHNTPRLPLQAQPDGAFAVTGPVVHLGVFPSAAVSITLATEILSAIDQVALQMDDEQLAVMLAPSSVLSDAGLSRDADEIRSTILRSGRVRAIVRLPAGLLLHKPQQAQTLWVLGAAHEGVDLADRWTMVANLASNRLDASTIADLVSDLVASLGDRVTVRAHAFRFARLAFTRTLIASRDSLVAGASSRATASQSQVHGAAALAVRINELLGSLRTPPPSFDLAEPAANTTADTQPRRMLTVEQRMAAGQLRYIPGNRLEEASLAHGVTGASGIRVIGAAEVLGERPLGSRSVDRLRFAADYPAGRLTEPGDVAFCTTPRPAAIVDTEGTSVVAFPARILRISPSGAAVLLGELLAADIAAFPARDKRWKSWPLREVDSSERAALRVALASLRSHRADLARRQAQLDELTTLLMSGIAADTLTLASTPAASASSKGTL